MKKKTKKMLWAVAPVFGLFTGTTVLSVSCSNNSKQPPINNGPVEDGSNIDYPETVAPGGEITSIIDLNQYTTNIESYLKNFSNVDSNSSFYLAKKNILSEINKLFDVNKQGIDVVIDFKYTLVNNSQGKIIQGLSLDLNQSFAYKFEPTQNFDYKVGTRDLRYLSPITTKWNATTTFNPNLDNFDPNYNNEYNVEFWTNNDGFLESNPTNLSVTTPLKVPSNYTNSKTTKTFSLYYSDNFDATTFDQFKPATGLTDSPITGNFNLNQTLNFNNLKQPGIYLVKFEFKQGSSQVTNLLCGYKIFGSLSKKDLGDWTTPRTFMFPINDTVTTTFNPGNLKFNGYDVNEYQDILQKKEATWDMSRATSGEYNFNVEIIDDNPFSSQYSNARSVTLTTNINNPLKGVQFNITNFNLNDSTATLSLTKPSLYSSQPRLNVLEDSISTNSDLAMVGLYKENNLNDNNSNWTKIDDLNNHGFEQYAGINQELNKVQDVSVTLGQDSVNQEGVAYTITATTGNGYRFNVIDSQYFSGYQGVADNNISIQKNNPYIILPSTDITYNLDQGATIGDVPSPKVGQPIIGSLLQFSVTAPANYPADDVVWQYQDTNKNWVDFPTDICETYVQDNKSCLIIPSTYNTKFSTFSIRVMSKSSSWMPSHYATYDVQTTPEGIYNVSATTLNGFKDGFKPSSLGNVDILVLPDNCTSINNRAFQNQARIRNLIIPNSYKKLGEFTFYNCDNLENVFINNGSNLELINHGTFEECNKLKSINLEDTSITEIGKWAFKKTALTNFIAPSTLKTIWNEAFKEINGKQEFNFDISKCTNGVDIQAEAFRYSTSLNLFMGTENIKNVWSNAFVDNINLNPNGNKTLIFGNNLVSLSKDSIAMSKSSNMFLNIDYMVFDCDENDNYKMPPQSIYFEKMPYLKAIFFKTEHAWNLFKEYIKNFRADHQLPKTFNKTTTYQGYIVLYNDPNPPAENPTAPSQKIYSNKINLTNKQIKPASNLASGTDNSVNNPVTPPENNGYTTINLTTTIPASLPNIVNNADVTSSYINYQLYYSSNLNETNNDNFLEVVDTNATNNQINKSDLGISNNVTGSTSLGQQISINNIKTQGTYKIVITYTIITKNATIICSKYNTITLQVLDNVQPPVASSPTKTKNS